MSAATRTVAGIRATTKSFVRSPFTVALLLVLPAISIQIYGVSMGQFPAVGIFDVSGSLTTTGQLTGAVFATGALAGVLGLFQMIGARNADRRLAICGFRGLELVGARFVTVGLLSLLAALVSTLSLAVLVEGGIGAPVSVFAGLVLAGAIYGFLGILVGSVLPRELEGSLLLVILADVDNVFASGLFPIEEEITRFAPLSHPSEIVSQAALEGTFATGHVLPAVTHLVVLGTLGIAAYTYRIEAGGGGS